VEVDIRSGLPALDVFAAAVDVIAESLCKAKMIEMRRNPARRARRSDRSRELRRQRPHEIDGADHRVDPLSKRSRSPLALPVVELRRERRSDACLDRVDKLPAAEPRVMLECLVDA